MIEQKENSMENLDQLKSELIHAINSAQDLSSLEEIRVSALGKKGTISNLMKNLGQTEPEIRKTAGQVLNILKTDIAAAINTRKEYLADASLSAKLDAERLDITLPIREQPKGTIHLIGHTIDEVVAIFGEMGFTVAEGPDIEEDWYNFTALNIPPEHPARQEHDTFYLPCKKGGHQKVLRTHTSPVQIRTMIKRKPPIRIICPGRVYRSDYDATHLPMFHQVEGLIVDKKIHMGHLKGCLIDFCRAFFNVDDLPVRFRPSYFPFTEPSAEVDIGCIRKDGELRIGRGENWLEILGTGMVNPKVLENCGIDSSKYQGFAFGMGVERIAMLKYGISDLRTFLENDLRWLQYYGIAAFDVPSMVRGLT